MCKTHSQFVFDLNSLGFHSGGKMPFLVYLPSLKFSESFRRLVVMRTSMRWSPGSLDLIKHGWSQDICNKISLVQTWRHVKHERAWEPGTNSLEPSPRGYGYTVVTIHYISSAKPFEEIQLCLCVCFSGLWFVDKVKYSAVFLVSRLVALRWRKNRTPAD